MEKKKKKNTQTRTNNRRDRLVYNTKRTTKYGVVAPRRAFKYRTCVEAAAHARYPRANNTRKSPNYNNIILDNKHKNNATSSPPHEKKNKIKWSV